MDSKQLAALVAEVPAKDVVYTEDAPVSAVAEPIVAATAPVTVENPALTSLTHYVFNTLRGAADTVDGATFEDVRNALVAQGY